MTKTIGESKSVLRDPFVCIAVLLFGAVIVCVVWIFYVVSNKTPPNADDPFQLLYFAARLMQITLGMLIGTAVTLLGVILAWFGITGKVDVSVESSPVKARLVSASPGALLVLCGTAIIMTCILLPFSIETKSEGVDVEPIPAAPSSTVQP